MPETRIWNLFLGLNEGRSCRTYLFHGDNCFGLSKVKRELNPVLEYKCIDHGKRDSEAFHATSVLYATFVFHWDESVVILKLFWTWFCCVFNFGIIARAVFLFWSWPKVEGADWVLLYSRTEGIWIGEPRAMSRFFLKLRLHGYYG